MKAKHLNVAAHNDLYKSIHSQIHSKLNLDKRKANRYFLFKGLFYFSLAIPSYALIYLIDNPFVFVLNFVLFGFIAVLLCFNFAHDLSHHAIFKRPFWDNLGFEFIYSLVGAHPEAWKKRHINSHHIAPNVANFDTDLAITGLIRVLPHGSRKWYHKYQYLYAPFAYMTYSFYWVFMKDFKVLKEFAPQAKQQQARYLATFIILKLFYLFYLLIFPMIYSSVSIWIVLIGFLLMHMVQSVYTLFTFFITHHVYDAEYPTASKEGHISTSWFMNQVKSSNDFYPFSKVANFIFGGVNNHVAHHLFPHISHYHYPKLNRILYSSLKEYGIVPNQTSYIGGVISHLKLLKKRGLKNE